MNSRMKGPVICERSYRYHLIGREIFEWSRKNLQGQLGEFWKSIDLVIFLAIFLGQFGAVVVEEVEKQGRESSREGGVAGEVE